MGSPGEGLGWKPRLGFRGDTSFLEYGLDVYIYAGDWKLVWFFSETGPSTEASGAGGQGKAVRQKTTTLTAVFRAGTQAGLLFVDVMFGLREEPAKKVPVMGVSDCAKVLWQQRLGKNVVFLLSAELPSRLLPYHWDENTNKK